MPYDHISRMRILHTAEEQATLSHCTHVGYTATEPQATYDNIAHMRIQKTAESLAI